MTNDSAIKFAFKCHVQELEKMVSLIE